MKSLSPTSPSLKCVSTSGLGFWMSMKCVGTSGPGFIHGVVVDLDVPEVVSQLDLKSELHLQGAVAELDVPTRTMKSPPVSGSSSPRSAKTELVARGGVGGT